LDLDGKKIIEWCPYTIAEVISYKAKLYPGCSIPVSAFCATVKDSTPFVGAPKLSLSPSSFGILTDFSDIWI
jgi:hypothetical protein